MSEVRASHLLVKHQGSRRPASWRDPDGAVITKRSKAAALDELEAYREQIESGAVTFADLREGVGLLQREARRRPRVLRSRKDAEGVRGEAEHPSEMLPTNRRLPLNQPFDLVFPKTKSAVLQVAQRT